MRGHEPAVLPLTVIILFLLFFIILQQLIYAVADQERKQDRLLYRRQGRLLNRLTLMLSRYERPYRHLSELLESMRWPIHAGGFVLLSGLIALTGITGGLLLFQSFKGTLLLSSLSGAAPYLWLRLALMNRQLKTRMDFLPAVELFYQCYLVTGGRQVRTALQRTVEERRLLGPIQTVFEQLYRNLSVRGDDESSLRIFSASVGHVWGDYFVQILRVALTEGNSVEDNLKDLITDMRKARRANQQERNRLLEIRIANFSPILFLALFIGINVRYNPEHAYYYYLIDPRGRDMLLNAVVLIFVSFVMGLYLSRKKM
ncbi:type II secretion system F family protein [Paenibacillus abyssi]|uniref:Type II secretion system protein GspF domain-containing protein n=1 Tax=Paenibacillus abyssi TaxID=1340531 RepID=A0A917D3I5_9BACL|nr:type II secretion system F family protein [Paenibacillus abyssi]GGG09175.1 hypothetical protein GCM10010916_27530 [Paenibacillus abyssi]